MDMEVRPSFNVSKKSFSENKKYNLEPSGKHEDGEGTLFKFFYYLGGYTQLYTKRVLKYFKRLFTPAAQFASVAFEKTVVERWMRFKNEAADVKGDFGTAARRFKSVKGFKGKSIEGFKIAVDGITKHHSITVKALNICAPLLTLLILFLTINHYANLNFALEVSYNGEKLGFIENEGVYTSATDMVNERIMSSDASTALESTPTFSLKIADPNTNFQLDNDICDNLLGATTGELTEAYGLTVNGEFVGAIESEGDMTFILDTYLKGFATGAKNETVEFLDLVEVTYGYYPVSGITDAESLQEKISKTQLTAEYYTVQTGDTAYGICKKFGMNLTDLKALNENLDQLMYPNRRVKITADRPTIQVRTISSSSYTQPIKFSTKTIKDETKYTDYKKLQTAGVNGVQRINEEKVYIDGILTETKVIDKIIEKEPVNEVYVVGTKKRAIVNNNNNNSNSNKNNGNKNNNKNNNTSINASGKFTWPVPGYTSVSSYYGKRWGRMHKGIDISRSGIYGASIVAADSGTVTVAGTSSSGYGKYIMIDHGNGYVTLYGHCSKLLVSKGQKVRKGQVIAKVGSTGRSTGPHLHFEIRKNGSHKNPLSYY